MQINNLTNFNQKSSGVTLPTNLERLNKSQTPSLIGSTSTQTATQYDVHDMSPNELKDLIRDLRESGQISEIDSMMFTMDRLDIERFGGVGGDTKMDMMDYFERLVDGMKSNPDSVGIEYEERSLGLLKALEAKNSANIPSSV